MKNVWMIWDNQRNKYIIGNNNGRKHYDSGVNRAIAYIRGRDKMRHDMNVRCHQKYVTCKMPEPIDPGRDEAHEYRLVRVDD